MQQRVKTEETPATHSPSKKKIREERALLLFNLMKSGTQAGEIVFSDEKMFNVEAQFYPQNDRVLSKSFGSVPEDLLTVYRRQKPASDMVWAAVSKSWESALFFCEKGRKSEHKRVH